MMYYLYLCSLVHLTHRRQQSVSTFHGLPNSFGKHSNDGRAHAQRVQTPDSLSI